ncbi:MAG: hypothetical protein Q9M89_00665 [Persephonella sp.]|nr:hypothetical protein [Persephonella sp.]
MRFYNVEEAEQFLKNVDLTDDNSLFWHSVLFLQMERPEEADSLIKEIDCKNLDINFVEYCRYIKGYILFATGKFEKALETLKSIDNPA